MRARKPSVSVGQAAFAGASLLPTSVLVTLELIGSRVHPQDIPLLNDMTDRARDDGSDSEYERRLLMPDGSVKYLHFGIAAPSSAAIVRHY